MRERERDDELFLSNARAFRGWIRAGAGDVVFLPTSSLGEDAFVNVLLFI